MDLNLHKHTDDPTSKLDPEVLSVLPRVTPNQAEIFGNVWDLFSDRGEPFSTVKFKVLTRNYTKPEVDVTASGSGSDWDTNSDTTDLPVDSGYMDRVTIGDVLLVESEIVIVSAVDRSNDTIDVYNRGSGDSTATSHGTSTITAKIVGNAHEEGKVQAEAMAETTGEVTNWTQLVEEKVDLSQTDTEQARKNGRTEDVLKAEATERLTQDLARTAIYGQGQQPSSSQPSTTRGLLSYLQDVSGGLETNVGGAFDETALTNMLEDIRAEGGQRPDAIVMSPNNKKEFNAFTDSQTTIDINEDRSANVAGRVIDSYLWETGQIPALVDIDMPDDRVAVVNSRYMEKGYQAGDGLRFEEETNTNSRRNEETLQGRFGLAVEQVGKAHGVMSGLTT